MHQCISVHSTAIVKRCIGKGCAHSPWSSLPILQHCHCLTPYPPTPRLLFPHCKDVWATIFSQPGQTIAKWLDRQPDPSIYSSPRQVKGPVPAIIHACYQDKAICKFLHCCKNPSHRRALLLSSTQKLQSKTVPSPPSCTCADGSNSSLHLLRKCGTRANISVPQDSVEGEVSSNAREWISLLSQDKTTTTICCPLYCVILSHLSTEVRFLL